MRTLCISTVALTASVFATTCARAQQQQTIFDKDIQVLKLTNPVYPAIAHTAHIEGVVVVRVSLDDKGSVTDATALSGPKFLIPASIDSAKASQYKRNPERAVIMVYRYVFSAPAREPNHDLVVLYRPNFVTIRAGYVPIEP
jgi:Gram-negative bacterial TonB protein C-terminal